MIAAQTALVAMVALPATVGGALAVLRPDRGAAPIALFTSAITVVLALVTALTHPTVSYPFGSALMKPCACALRAAATTCASLAPGRP